ncbi:hypothetical protein RB195_019172 [Necator americanus]|uniref:Uncharacterized protein n=1 Tax=Necator americanus TaxID=51031 RepID=A0ABR1CE02_NECAM
MGIWSEAEGLNRSMGGAHVSRLPGHKPRIKQGGAADSSLAAVLTSSDSVAPRGHHAVFYATQARDCTAIATL